MANVMSWMGMFRLYGEIGLFFVWAVALTSIGLWAGLRHRRGAWWLVLGAGGLEIVRALLGVVILILLHSHTGRVIGPVGLARAFIGALSGLVLLVALILLALDRPRRPVADPRELQDVGNGSGEPGVTS